MRILRYNPFNELALQENPFNNLFNDVFFNTNPKTNDSFYPAVDILNEKDNVILNIELPGIKKENISIDIIDKVMTIKGEKKFETSEKKDHYFRKERSYGNFERSFRLSNDVLTDDVTADFNDGVLKLTLKKDTTKEEVKQITIN